MALLWRGPPFSGLQSHTCTPFPRLSVLELLIPRRNTLRISSASIFSPSKPRHPSYCSITCCLSSSSSIECDESPSTRIFIKGLPQSTSEGSLTKAFSQFGEVNRAKIITNKKSRQSLGFAYIWFTTEESAQLAAKEMNGKFCDGRFVFVTIARPGPSKIRVKRTPYKF